MNNNLRVVIDAGHGGSDPGAVANGIREKDLTLPISQYMLERFRELGIPATLVRSTDETVSPTERVRRILEAYGNDPNVVVISNHINSAGSNAEGAEVIYALRNDSTLARNILQELGNAGQVTRTYYQRRLPSDPTKDYYFIMRNTGNTQPVLVEYGFITNPTDIARVQSNYKKYVDAVVNAVVKTFLGGTSGKTYIVRAGDSLWVIAQKYNTTVDELKKLNNLTSNTLSIGQILEIPTGTVVPGAGNRYVVKAGDTLWSIAQQFDTSVNEIKTLNNLTTNMITIGQQLQIPSSSNAGTGTQYVVKAGDTLWNIAQRYNTTVNNIRKLNNLTSDILSIGQVLFI